MVSPEGTGSGLSAMASARDGAAPPEAGAAAGAGARRVWGGVGEREWGRSRKPSPSLSKVSPQSPTPATPVSVSQALPKASPSALAWLALGVLGQLSEALGTPSPSASGRQPESAPSTKAAPPASARGAGAP